MEKKKTKEKETSFPTAHTRSQTNIMQYYFYSSTKLLLLFSFYLLGVHSELRRISESELSSKNGAGGEGDVWLAVLGKVYDVTDGRRFYGEGGSYSVFGAKDATGNFATGKFDEESVKHVNYAELSKDAMDGLKHWDQFYANNEKYPHIGYVPGLFYDEGGNPTELLVDLRKRMEPEQEL